MREQSSHAHPPRLGRERAIQSPHPIPGSGRYRRQRTRTGPGRGARIRPVTSDDCVFCGIVERRLDASVVHESANVLAIMDIDPVTPGHVLVLPRAHLPELADLDDDLAAEMFAVARSVAAALRRSPLRSEGVNLFYADGEAAFQEVFHSHLHVFPRFADDGFTIGARWGSNPSRAELDANAATLRAELRPPGPAEA
ncbi:HIT family protein [Cellulomonas sp. zg-B89]|nr:HIT family protein [Cellulomonas xiejunii]